MKLVKKIKIKINKECKEYLNFASERCRLIYNFSLHDKIEAYKKNKTNISIYELKKQLPKIKEEYPEYKNVYNKCLSAMYFRLNKAYNYFFKKNNKFPKYKRKGLFISQEYPASYINVIDEHRFKLPTGKNYPIFIVRTKEKIPENFTTLTITKNKNIYFACFTIDYEENKMKKDRETLSIDLGVKTLVSGITTDNKIIKVDKFSHYTKHLDLLRSKRDRCKKGSRRYKKYNLVFHRELRRYKNRVGDYMHKVSNWLVEKLDYNLVIGNLNLKNMKSNQTWFNKILLNEWRVGKFVEMLSYKSVKYGKEFYKVDESYTSKTCFKCGRIKDDLKLSDRIYKCSCGYIMDRDINGALNILEKYSLAQAVKVKHNLDEFVSANNLNMFKYI